MTKFFVYKVILKSTKKHTEFSELFLPYFRRLVRLQNSFQYQEFISSFVFNLPLSRISAKNTRNRSAITHILHIIFLLKRWMNIPVTFFYHSRYLSDFVQFGGMSPSELSFFKFILWFYSITTNTSKKSVFFSILEAFSFSATCLFPKSTLHLLTDHKIVLILIGTFMLPREVVNFEVRPKIRLQINAAVNETCYLHSLMYA